MGRRKTSWTRRIVMPAVILVGAGGLAILGLRERADQRVEVERFVAKLVDDVATGRDPAAYLVHSDPLVTRPVLEALQLEETWNPRDFDIVITEGDPESEANLLQPATHTATIERDDRVVFGLRLVHHGRRDRIAIIGFWRPPADQGG